MASASDSTRLRQRNNLRSGQTFPMSMLQSKVVDNTHPGGTGQDYLRIPSAASGDIDDETLSGRSPRQSGESINQENIQDQDNSPLVQSERPNHSATDDATETPGTKDDTRRPKCITRSGRSRYFHGWIVHLPAVFLTIVVLVIGKMRIYWYPEHGPLIGNSYGLDAEVISNVLQFVAKIHELLIVASLASIALAMFRRRLITDGVRLGFLTGSYRVGDLAYLGTAAFWRQGLNFLEPWEILLSGFLVFATIMSTIVGPASAVLLIPSLDWYDFKPGIGFGNIEQPLLYWWRAKSVWTETYTENLENYHLCNTVLGIYTPGCPAGGFNEIQTWVENHGATQLENNLTFSATSDDIRRHVVFTQSSFSQNTTNTTLSTTAPQFILDSIGLFQRYIKNANVSAVAIESRYRLRITRQDGAPDPSLAQLYQPFVQSKCEVHDKDWVRSTPENITYPDPVKYFRCFNKTECLDKREDLPIFDKTLQYMDKFNTFSTASSYWTTGRSSSVMFLNGFLPNTTSETGDQTNIIYLCTLTANWVPSNFSTDSGVNDVLHSTLSDGKTMRDIYFNSAVHGILPMVFEQSWFEHADPRWDSGANTTALARIVENFARRKQQNGTIRAYSALGDSHDNIRIEGFLAKVFGGYLTDALARSSFGQRTRILSKKTETELVFMDLHEQYGYRGGRHTYTRDDRGGILDKWGDKSHEPEPLANYTFDEAKEDFEKSLALNIHPQRYGYGSGQERKTALFAQAMLLIYLGTVAIYAATIVVGYVMEYHLEKEQRPGRFQSVVPWSDLQELFVLGLRTPPPSGDDLADAGAGVSSSRVWEKVIAARADDKDNLHLVFEGTSLKELELNGGKNKLYF